MLYTQGLYILGAMCSADDGSNSGDDNKWLHSGDELYSESYHESDVSTPKLNYTEVLKAHGYIC